MPENKYTSNLLCHFVGRSKRTDDERFELLITIIKGAQLIANLSNPQKLESRFHNGYRCEHVGEVFEKCDCVCFCDIPDKSLEIHTNKYSKFGIGFEKTFLAGQGAHPVMYVPQNYPIVERSDESSTGKSHTPRDPEQYFSYILWVTTNLLPLMELGYSGVDLSHQEQILDQLGLGNYLNLFDDSVRNAFFSEKYHSMIYSILHGIANQMSYVKLYDANLPDDHPDNYYMEREWRSLKNITFTINDIKTIYLPSIQYKERFLKEIPEYSGTFFFLDKNI